MMQLSWTKSSQNYGSIATLDHTRRYSIYLSRGMEGWVDPGDWLRTEMVYVPPSTNEYIPP